VDGIRDGIRFEWDEAKNLFDQRKHGISFRQASAVFLDPLYVSVQDRIEDGELHWPAAGVVEDLLLLTVAHTVREEMKARPSTSSASSRRASRPAKSGGAMKTRMVSYTLDTLPPLTKADRARLKALAARPDAQIDTSDIPEMSDEQWKRAPRGHFYRPRKR